MTFQKFKRLVISRALLAGIVIVGAALRLYGLTAANWYGFDENITIGLASLPWRGFLHAMLSREMNMVAYYGLVRLWSDLYSGLDPLWFVRALSALFSIATIPLLYVLGKKLFSENVGLLAAGLLAINAFHLKHAHNARSYSMFAFLVTLATLLLVNNLKSASPKWALYVAVWIVTIYTHVFAFWFLAAHLVVLAANHRRILHGNQSRRIVASLATIFVGAAPMALWTVTHHGQPLDWVHPTTARSVAELFAVLVGDDGFFLLFVAVFAMLPALLDAVKGNESARLVLVWALAPIALTIVVSWIQPCFVPRFLVPSLPATTLLTAAGLEKWASLERYKILPAAVLLTLIIFGMLNGSQAVGA